MNNTANISQSETRESTYALLVRSEEKSRSILETAVYALFILSAVFSIWQAAHQPVMLPESITTASVAVLQNAGHQQRS